MLPSRIPYFLLGLLAVAASNALAAPFTVSSAPTALTGQVGDMVSGTYVVSFDSQYTAANPFQFVGYDLKVTYDSSKLSLSEANTTLAFLGQTPVTINSLGGVSTSGVSSNGEYNLHATPSLDMDPNSPNYLNFIPFNAWGDVTMTLSFVIAGAGTSTVEVGPVDANGNPTTSLTVDDGSSAGQPYYYNGSFDVTGTNPPPSGVPEPGSVLLGTTGLLAALLRRRYH